MSKPSDDELIADMERYDTRNHRGKYAVLVRRGAARLRELLAENAGLRAAIEQHEQERQRLLGEIELLQRDGPILDDELFCDGKSVPCTMRRALNYARAAATAEGKAGDEARIERDAAIDRAEAAEQENKRLLATIESFRDGLTEARCHRDNAIQDREAAERRAEAAIDAIAEFIVAWDESHDPTIVGSTCRLMRAEGGLRDLLSDALAAAKEPREVTPDEHATLQKALFRSTTRVEDKGEKA